MTVDLEHVAEWAMWEGMRQGKRGDGLYLHIRAAYPLQRPWRGGCSQQWSWWLRRARVLSGLKSQEQGVCAWVQGQITRMGEEHVLQHLRVDRARLVKWMRGGEDVRLMRRARVWRATCEG